LLCIIRKLARKSYPQVIHHALKNWWITLFSQGGRNVTMKWGKVGHIGEFVEWLVNIGVESLKEGVTSGSGSHL
jgi:hypothetical protein